MNSRRAKNDNSANSTKATLSPANQPTQNTSPMTQLVRSTPSALLNSLRLRSATASSSGSRRDNTTSTAVTTVNKPKTRKKRAPTCWLADKFLSDWYMLKRLSAR